jgi:hypothetical protein
MNEREQERESTRAQKVKDPARQSWYNVKRLAQAILRRPEDLDRLAKQIISTADNNLEK